MIVDCLVFTGWTHCTHDCRFQRRCGALTTYVRVCAAGFLEKNRDSFSADLMQIVHNSSNKFMHTLFQEDLNMGSGGSTAPDWIARDRGRECLV